MTTQEKLAFILDKCVERNPLLKRNKKIGIAGVLNAIMYSDTIVCLASNERFEVLDKATNTWKQVYHTWYLTNDNVREQAKETIDFIYKILK